MRFFYLRDKKGMPVVTVATIYEPNWKRVYYGLSTLNVRLDSFDYLEGRARAAERVDLRNTNFVIVMNGGKVKEALVLTIANDARNPQRTREAARLWLKQPPQKKIKRSKVFKDPFPVPSGYRFTGEVRPAKKGEWYANPLNQPPYSYPLQAIEDHERGNNQYIITSVGEVHPTADVAALGGCTPIIGAEADFKW